MHECKSIIPIEVKVLLFDIKVDYCFLLTKSTCTSTVYPCLYNFVTNYTPVMSCLTFLTCTFFSWLVWLKTFIASIWNIILSTVHYEILNRPNHIWRLWEVKKYPCLVQISLKNYIFSHNLVHFPVSLESYAG